MNIERDPTRIVETWLAEPVPSLDDRVINQTIDRLPGLRQRRRWWPFRWIPLGIGATRSTDSLGPRSHGRSTSMFNATRIVALVAIVALFGGSLALVVGPLGQTDPVLVPGAATPSASPEASDEVHFTGILSFPNPFGGVPGKTETGPDGIERNRGAATETKWTSSDPRFSGAGSITTNHNDYIAESGEVIRVGWGTQELANDIGGWQQGIDVGAGVLRDPMGAVEGDDSRIAGWFDGVEGYEGQSAFVVFTIWGSATQGILWDYEGWIVPGDAHLTEMSE